MTREGCEAKLNVSTAHYYLFLAYFIRGQKKITLKEDKIELTQFMDVDGFAAHTFTTFAHGFDLNQIVAIGGEGELHSSLVGKKSGDIIVVVLFQEHLRQEKMFTITSLNCKEKSCFKLAHTKYPVTFDSVSIATTGSQCRDSVEPIIVHCMLCGARSGAKTGRIKTA